MHTGWEVGGRGRPGRESVWARKCHHRWGLCKSLQRILWKTERKGGSGAVSDRLASETLPVWFPFKSTHMARSCLKVSSMLCTLPQEQECLRFSEPGGRCGPGSPPHPHLAPSKQQEKETQAVPGQRSSEMGSWFQGLHCLGVPWCPHLYAG